MAAAAQVFETYELLENILLHLPLRSLLLSQRTCRKFRDLAERSLRVKQALFLESSTRPGVRWAEDIVFERFKGGQFTLRSRAWKQVGQTEKPVVILNPFLDLVLPRKRNEIFVESSKCLAVSLRCATLHGCSKDCRFDNHSGPFTSTSLAQMQLPDPPILQAAVRVTNIPTSSGDYVVLTYARSMSSLKGLQYGDVYTQLDVSEKSGAQEVEVYLYGGRKMWRIVKTVDSVTGWECLQVLQDGTEMRKRSSEVRPFVDDD